MTQASTDRIEKEIIVHAPRSKVWRAISDHREFGKWFQAAMKDPFTPGALSKGNITYPGYEHLKMEIHVERVEPEHHFSFRWHPYAIDPQTDYSREPTTLVVFELEEDPEGTRVKVTESGFDAIPIERREKAFRMNSGGWEQQMQNIANYVGSTK